MFTSSSSYRYVHGRLDAPETDTASICLLSSDFDRAEGVLVGFCLDDKLSSVVVLIVEEHCPQGDSE